MGNTIRRFLDLLNEFEVVDLSPTLENDIPRWPTHPPLVIQPTVTHPHDGYYCQTIFMGEHTGAHVDAPAHQVPAMMESTIETYPADYICGRAVVYDLGSLNAKKQDEIVQRYIRSLNIKTPGAGQQIHNLSGGNQQKVLLARWLCMEPDLIILDEPTRGIDVGAKSEIESLIQEIAGRGIGVLLISSELEELVRNCHRVVVVRDGRNVGDLEGNAISEETIMERIAQGAAKEESHENG